MSNQETTRNEQETERKACEESVFNSIRMGHFSVADLNFINALVLALWKSQPSALLMSPNTQEGEDDQPWL